MRTQFFIIMQEHTQKVAGAFSFYKQHAFERVVRAKKSFDAIPPRHQALLPRFRPKLKEFNKAIAANYILLHKIAEQVEIFSVDQVGGNFLYYFYFLKMVTSLIETGNNI